MAEGMTQPLQEEVKNADGTFTDKKPSVASAMDKVVGKITGVDPSNPSEAEAAKAAEPGAGDAAPDKAAGKNSLKIIRLIKVTVSCWTLPNFFAF